MHVDRHGRDGRKWKCGLSIMGARLNFQCARVRGEENTLCVFFLFLSRWLSAFGNFRVQREVLRLKFMRRSWKLSKIGFSGPRRGRFFTPLKSFVLAIGSFNVNVGWWM